MRLGDIRSSEHLVPEPDGFIIKAFFACSRTDTRPFKIASETTHINQTLRVVNIGGQELEFWLCTTHNKIIVRLPSHRLMQRFPFLVISDHLMKFLLILK